MVSTANIGRRRDVPCRISPIALITLCLAPCILVGCSIVPTYPRNLPALENVSTQLEACPPIAGRYLDVGEAFSPDGKALGFISLTRVLHLNGWQPSSADVVVVSNTDDLVELDTFNGSERKAHWYQAKITKEAYLSRGDQVAGETFLCQDGYVRLGRSYHFQIGGAPGLFLVEGKSDFLWLRRSLDGSLIALHTDMAGMLLYFLIPVGETKIDKVWYRFPSAAPLGTTIPRPDSD